MPYDTSQCRTECKCVWTIVTPCCLRKRLHLSLGIQCFSLHVFHLSISESADVEFMNTLGPLELQQGLCVFLAWNIFYLDCFGKKFASSYLYNNESCFDMKPACSSSHNLRYHSGIMLWGPFSACVLNTAQVLQESANHDLNKVSTKQSFRVQGIFLSVLVRLCSGWPRSQAGMHRHLETCMCVTCWYKGELHWFFDWQLMELTRGSRVLVLCAQWLSFYLMPAGSLPDKFHSHDCKLHLHSWNIYLLRISAYLMFCPNTQEVPVHGNPHYPHKRKLSVVVRTVRRPHYAGYFYINLT